MRHLREDELAGHTGIEPFFRRWRPRKLAGLQTAVHDQRGRDIRQSWAMAFLPGARTAVVTEKPGHIWLVDVRTGQKLAVAGAPRVLYGGQGGLLDIVLAPGFASNNQVYLTYSEPSPSGGSSLALARATLVRETGAARLEGLQLLWHDPAGGEGGQFGAVIAFAPDGKSLFLSSGERQRFTPAQEPSQPRQDPALNSRW